MSETRIRIDPDDPRSLPPGRVDYTVLDVTTEVDIARQAREDDAQTMRDTASATVSLVPTRGSELQERYRTPLVTKKRKVTCISRSELPRLVDASFVCQSDWHSEWLM